MDLCSDWFFLDFMWFNTSLDFCHTIIQGFTLSPMENDQCSFKYFEQLMCGCIHLKDIGIS